MFNIGYNSQRDNAAVRGLSPHVQCFATSAWMFLSYFAPEKYPYNNDELLSYYIMDVIRNGKDKEFEWKDQAEMIQKYLDAAGVQKKVHLAIDLNSGRGKLSIADLEAVLKVSPVIVGTKKMGGLPGGHIILAKGAVTDHFISCNDPYGNANSNYSSADGDGVLYHYSMFDKADPENIRGIYAV